MAPAAAAAAAVAAVAAAVAAVAATASTAAADARRYYDGLIFATATTGVSCPQLAIPYVVSVKSSDPHSYLSRIFWGWSFP